MTQAATPTPRLARTKVDTGMLGLSVRSSLAGTIVNVAPFQVMPGAEPSKEFYKELPHGPVWPVELLEFLPG